MNEINNYIYNTKITCHMENHFQFSEQNPKIKIQNGSKSLLIRKFFVLC